MKREVFDPLTYLSAVFGLSLMERFMVERLLEAGEPGLGRRELTEQALSAMEDGISKEGRLKAEAAACFWPDSPLMRYFLRERRETATFILDERIRVFLEGKLDGYGPYDFLWERIEPEEGVHLEGKSPLPLIRRFREKQGEGSACWFHLYGAEGTGKKSRILEYCREQDRPLLVLEGRILEEENEELLGDALRECRIYGAFLCIRKFSPEWLSRSLYRKRLFLWMAAEAELLFTTAEEPLYPGSCPKELACLEIGLSMPDYRESCSLWDRELKKQGVTNINPEEWANKFLFTPGQIREAVEAAAQYAFQENTVMSRELLQRGCYQLLRGGMGKKAVRIRSCYTWEELVLPKSQKQKLRDACNQAACKKKVYETWGFGRRIAYGRGISVVFAGPPGTGKTMAAQVMASELCLDLYRIELPAVVSKYIGETEKNLEEIFEQAGKSQVILFFDEADVLFSKRTQVRDSNDKYSNMEAAFLLQKMEEYEGITVLATNFLQNFDEAFKRRMKFIIDFPFPDAEQRMRIWRQTFPAETPVGGELDYDFLAGTFELSGSNIKNAALHAAFLAAAASEPVSMAHVLAGIRNEFEKSGKTLGREQLGQYYMLL